MTTTRPQAKQSYRHEFLCLHTILNAIFSVTLNSSWVQIHGSVWFCAKLNGSILVVCPLLKMLKGTASYWLTRSKSSTHFPLFWLIWFLPKRFPGPHFLAHSIVTGTIAEAKSTAFILFLSWENSPHSDSHQFHRSLHGMPHNLQNWELDLVLGEKRPSFPVWVEIGRGKLVEEKLAPTLPKLQTTDTLWSNCKVRKRKLFRKLHLHISGI